MSDQRFNTGNPIGSNSPLDRSDNTRNLDVAVNSGELEWVDRLGQSRRTLAGVDVAVAGVEAAATVALEQTIPGIIEDIDAEATASLDAAESGWENRFQVSQDRREGEFQADQADRETEFRTFIASSGYQFAGDYAPGIEITEYNQVIRDENGEFWRVSGQVELPYMTTGGGIPEGNALVPAGDAVLRQDLANPDKGARLVRGAVIYVNTIADLQALDTEGLPEGAVAVVSGRGEYTYSASANQFFPASSYHNFAKQGDAARQEDPSTRKRHHPTIPVIPMGDMGLDGQAVHPSVVKIPHGFGPQRFVYWMAVTPYQNTNDQTENPCIYGSLDGATWHVPDGVINPLVPTPGTSIDHNSDPCLLHYNGELWYYYRESLKSVDPREDNIYLMKSVDGVTWSSPEICSIPSGLRNTSPAVVHNGNEFVMYLLRTRWDIVERRTSANGITWSEPEAVSFVGTFGGSPWHFHVIIRNNRYEMIINAWDGPISFATSPLSDGLTFTKLSYVLFKEYPFESTALYHACLTPEEGDTPENYEVWYSAQSGNKWTVARVSATLSSEGLIPVIDNKPVSIYGSLNAVSGYFHKISTTEPIENPAILTGLSAATGTTMHRRAVVASTDSTASGLDSVVSASTDCTASGASSAVIASSNDCKASGIRTVVLASINSSATSSSGTSAVVASTDQSEASGPRSAVMSSFTSTASGDRSAVIASRDGIASGNSSIVAASGLSTASGDKSAVVASTNSAASGVGSAVIASTNSTASGLVDSAVIASLDCLSSNTRSLVIASRSVENNLSGSVAMGINSSGVPSTANQTLRLEGSSGTIRATNTTIQGMDYAELFENGTGAEIEPGTLLTLDVGGRVVPADSSDSIVGVVSHTYGLLGGESFSCWNRRYLKDEWGRDIWEEVPDSDDPEQVIKMRKENPDYDPDANYVPRLERPAEWTTVGLLGQVLVRVGDSVSPGNIVAADDGVGVPSEAPTGVRCISVKQPFDAERGYAIALCLINVRV